MKNYFRICPHLLNWFPLITGVYFLVLAVLSPWSERNVLIGIPPSSMRGNLDLNYLSGWLLLMSTPILIDGCLLAYLGHVKTLVCIRLKKWFGWNMYLFVVCCSSTMYWSILQWAVLFITAEFHEALQAGTLLLASNMLWLVLMLLLYYLTKAASICVLGPIFMQGGTFLLGEHLNILQSWMPSNWSMVCRTKRCWEGGKTVGQYFGLSIAIAGCLFLLLYQMVRKKLYKEI